MKVLVPVKRVVDPNVQVGIQEDGQDVDIAYVKMSPNPFDEIALEEAVRLREKGQVSEIIAVSCGTSACQDVLRSALAMGADRAMLVQTDTPLTPLNVAKLLKEIALQQDVQLILMGKQAIDDDANQTAQMTAALLDWPQATFASKIELNDQHALVTCQTNQGESRVRLTLPALITADLRMNEPRFVTLPNLMKARKKPIETCPADSLNVEIKTTLTRVKVAEPTQRSAGKQVDSIEQLIDELKQAKVI